MTRARYNIAIIGRTGVGKSTLINTLLGRGVAATRAGRPMTAVGFHRHDFDLRSTPTTLFDSWGLESGRAEEWKGMLVEELRLRSPEKPPETWFHTVLYCVGAGGLRIEPFELAILSELAAENYRVLVVLTKADQATRAELETLTEVLDEHGGGVAAVIPVCAEQKETLSGPTALMGIDELKLEIFRGFWSAVADRLPARFVALAHGMIDGWARSEHEHVNREVGVFGHTKLAEQMKERTDAFAGALAAKGGPHSLSSLLESELRRTTEMFLEFSGALRSSDMDGITRPLSTLVSFDAIFPEVGHGARIGLGVLFSILSPTLVLIPLWWINKAFARADINKAVDVSAEKLKRAVSEMEPEVRRILSEIAEDSIKGV